MEATWEGSLILSPRRLNREANTILSKANDITVSNMAIDLKTEIEKIREQVQNIDNRRTYGTADQYWIWKYGKCR